MCSRTGLYGGRKRAQAGAGKRSSKKAIEGGIKPQENSPIEAELRDDRYVVTFVCIWPPETLGPDYSAKVTIDARSGEVLEILAGS